MSLDQECQFCGNRKRDHELACPGEPFQGFIGPDGRYAGAGWAEPVTPLLILGDGVEIEDALVPRCQTCRWWDVGGEAFRRKHYGLTGGICRMVETEDSLVSIFSESATGHAVLTAPDFGCVQWEAKRDE